MTLTPCRVKTTTFFQLLDQTQHIVEGDTVLSYTKPQIGNVGHYDPALKRDGQLLREGYIALQSESHPVEFRKVSLFDLSSYVDKPKQLKTVLQQLRNRRVN